MIEYVPRNQVLEIIRRTSGDYAAAWAEVHKLPAADVEPIVHGYWKRDGKFEEWSERRTCSVCGYSPGKYAYQLAPNCPEFRAIMDLEVPPRE